MGIKGVSGLGYLGVRGFGLRVGGVGLWFKFRVFGGLDHGSGWDSVLYSWVYRV